MSDKAKEVLKHTITIACVLLICMLSFSAAAHSGGTDSNGGHYDHSTGEYHYHHGNPAHQHKDGYCPYSLSDTIAESVNGSGWVYWLVGIMALIICTCVWLIKEKNKELEHCYKNLSSYATEIEQIKESTKNAEEKAVIPYAERVHDLESQVKSLKEKLNEVNSELLHNKRLVSNFKKAPKGILFADDGMPIFYKPNADKPYGDYTVYLSKSKIYHTDRFCSAYHAQKTHIFKVIDCGRPCKKCAEGFFNFDTVPEWFKR